MELQYNLSVSLSYVLPLLYFHCIHYSFIDFPYFHSYSPFLSSTACTISNRIPSSTPLIFTLPFTHHHSSSSLLFSTNTPREEPTHHRPQNRLPLHSHHIRHVSHRTHVIRHHNIERLVRKLPRLPSNPPLSPTFSPNRITSRSPGSPRTLFSGRIM